jgi:hypothetical protein
MGWLIVGIVGYTFVVLFALSMCQAAKRGDRQLGIKE